MQSEHNRRAPEKDRWRILKFDPTTGKAVLAGESGCGTLVLTENDLLRHDAIDPSNRSFLKAIQNWERQRCKGRLRLKKPSEVLFPSDSALAQDGVAQAYTEVARWLQKPGTTWCDEAMRPDRDSWKILLDQSQNLGIAPPPLFEIAAEVRERAGLPDVHHGCRMYPLRQAESTVALQIPLLEKAEKPKADEPLKLRAFMGWLKIEKVPVPRWDAGEHAGQPMWDSGWAYGAPVFALLDQDEAWLGAHPGGG